MTRGINKVILVGNVGKDAQMKALPSGGAVTNFALATSEIYNDKTTGERKERTEWHNVVAFGKLAEIMGEHVRKGSQLYIEGRLQTRKWQDQNGNDRYSTEIVAEQMSMLGGRERVDAAPAPAVRETPRPAAGPARTPRPAGGGYGTRPNPPPVPVGDFADDDIPF